jgi:hypothetical protein
MQSTGGPLELFTQFFGKLLVIVYHSFDRTVIHGYLWVAKP